MALVVEGRTLMHEEEMFRAQCRKAGGYNALCERFHCAMKMVLCKKKLCCFLDLPSALHPLFWA